MQQQLYAVPKMRPVIFNSSPAVMVNGLGNGMAVVTPLAPPTQGQRTAFLSGAPRLAERARLGGWITAVTHSAPAAPMPTAPKIQPQLQDLPRFRPPSFEGANGTLPCPDSPGSTPRSCEGDGVLSPEKLGSYAVGATVEYKSLTSGQWITARVQGFNAENYTYRLDVQQNARPERVRLRGDGGAGGAGATSSSPQLMVEPYRVAELPEATERGAMSSGRPVATVGPATPRGVCCLEDLPPPMLTAVTPPSPWSTVESASLHTEAKEPLARRSLSRLGVGAVASGFLAALQGLGTGGVEVAAEADQADLLAVAEVTALRAQVAQLHCENEQLREQVAQEACLKERYFQELCICHEQRVRGTPRS